MTERYLSVEEVADRLGDKPETIRRLLRIGRIAGEKNGVGHKTNPWRVTETALAKYVESRAPKRPTEAP